MVTLASPGEVCELEELDTIAEGRAAVFVLAASKLLANCVVLIFNFMKCFCYQSIADRSRNLFI